MNISKTCTHIYGYRKNPQCCGKGYVLYTKKAVEDLKDFITKLRLLQCCDHFEGKSLELHLGLVEYEFCPLCGKNLEVYHLDPLSDE